MFSSIKNTVKSLAPALSRPSGFKKAEKQPKMIDLAAMRNNMFPHLVKSRPRKSENEYEMVDFSLDDFDYVEWQDYKTGFFTVGEGFTILPYPVSSQLVEVDD